MGTHIDLILTLRGRRPSLSEGLRRRTQWKCGAICPDEGGKLGRERRGVSMDSKPPGYSETIPQACVGRLSVCFFAGIKPQCTLIGYLYRGTPKRNDRKPFKPEGASLRSQDSRPPPRSGFSTPFMSINPD